jgi:hypothetical protein
MGTSIDYSAVSHETIYQQITGGPGGAELMDASRGWQSVAAKLRELQGVVEQAIRIIGAAQQGAAADAATHATMALMPWLDDSVTAANGMAARILHQADTFEHIRDSMPTPLEVPEVPFIQDPSTWLGEHAVEWLPGIQTEHERAQVAAQQAEQRARELMSCYQSTSNDNLAISRYFAVAPMVVADVLNPALDAPEVGGASVGVSVPPSLTHSGAAHPTLAVASPAAISPAAAGAPAGTAPQIASGIHQPPAPATSPQLAGGHPNPEGQLMTGAAQARLAEAGAFGASPILSGSSSANGYWLSGRSPISGSPVSRGSGFGPRPSAALNETHSPTGSAGHASAEHAGAGRVARSDGGWTNPLLGATGGSGRDANTEHRRPSYLVEQDTNAIVGDLPRVAPPVIGED